MMLPWNNLMKAASFAARMHHGQLRKDGTTPYASHPFRVCLVLQLVFKISDPAMLTAALLHDVLEDTLADYDDIVELFGEDVAGLVRIMTKDKRLPEVEREAQYIRQLCDAGWRVHVLKLADVYDNLADSGSLPTDKRTKTLKRCQSYLDGLCRDLTDESRPAWAIVAQQMAVATGQPG